MSVKGKWINDKSEVEGEEAKEYWLCWVTTERSESGPYYAGADLSFIHLTPFST
jgi:hypothetical protein